MTYKSYISIDGGTSAQIKKAINEWINLYAKSLPPDFRLDYYKVETNKHVVIPDQRLDNERFNFLVNYLNYPGDSEYKIQVKGYTVISDTKIYPKEKLNYEIEIFIPPDDNEFDNVYAVTQYNEIFKIDFGGKTTRVNIKKEYTKPNIDFTVLTNPQIIRIKHKDPLEEENLLRTKLIKRVEIISIIIPCLFTLSYLTVGNSSTFIFLNSAICFGICYWLIVDYKMLQWLRTYMISLIIAIIVLTYRYILTGYFPINSRFLKAASLIPTFILVIQLPLRLGFKKIFNREPVVDRPAPSTADFFYSIILIISAVSVFIMTL
jgi:hypothetical protein